jgi:microcystin-dependent protein
MLLEALLGEIRIFATDDIPENWLPCDGRTINIRDNPALFALLGVMYGGNGTTTYALPDLRARIPISVGDDREQGSRAAAASAKGTSADQQFLALNFCICATYGIFPPRP